MASTCLHNAIVKFNVLKEPTDRLREYFSTRPEFYKVALIVNHIFRAVSMTAFSLLLPFSLPVNLAICLAGSLFYRLTVETNCAYKFALPAFAGSLAIPLAISGAVALVSGVAFASIGTLALATGSLLPCGAYLTYVVLTVSYDVDHR